jgi:hypothetical protein
VTGLVDTQRTSLSAIVERRRDIATQLRRFMLGETPDLTTVLDLASQYGELDGAIIYRYATNFTQVGALLSASQQAELDALRAKMLGQFPLTPDPKAYRYAGMQLGNQQMPAIRDLYRIWGTRAGAFRIRAASVTTDDLDPGMILEPLGQALRRAVGE